MENNKHKKILVAVLFGGKSAEHEVSVQSAKNVVAALDTHKYDVTLIGIDKNGTWLPYNISQLPLVKTILLEDQENIESSIIPFLNQGRGGFKDPDGSKKIDVVFPVLHGPMGEDGTIQGLLKLANVPFVGAGVLGSAVGMDKDVTKRLLRDAGLPIANFIVFEKHKRREISFEKVKEGIGLPFFIKPANLGSSVGITKIHSKKKFNAAIDLAFTYDNKIIIEEYIHGKEIECAVLGNESPTASICGEVTPNHEFYSYEAKYLDDNGAVLSIPALIGNLITKKIQKLAIKTFEVLCCNGMARVDFFVTKNNKIYINEINTIPGFTAISMYPKLWEASGIPYAKLVDTLITLAIKRFEKEQKLLTSK
jgi:D-alanine-D-alanine ligase